MNNKNAKNLLSLIPLTLMLAACSGSPHRASSLADAPYEVSEDYNSGVIRYTVQRGDRLGDIAQEFTGLSSRWREIAEHNNIANARKLQEGSVIEIPTALIPGYKRPTPVTAAEPVLAEPVAQTSSLAVRRDEPAAVSSVVITPINTNRNFELNPLDERRTNPERTFAGTGTQIKVVGSYYPKGIYTEPAAYSKLIMRVAPGTIFKLDSQVNEWYRIETSTGRGYIRISDAAIIE